MQDFIELGQYLADEAGQIIRGHFRRPFDVDTKADASPVTIADRGVEQRLRAIIEEKRPEDGIIGEEFGIKEGKNQYQWVLDPIDGTKSFVIGRPTFGTLIALCENGVPVMGMIDQPILTERWIGAKGQPTLFNGKSVSTRSCPKLSKARLASTDPAQLPHEWEKLKQASAQFIWGGDCYSYGLLSMGGLDGVIETQLGTYDYCALPPIVEGAGGWMGDWNGKALTTKSDGRTIAVGDITLKDQLIDLLK
ncbi:MAG TPA: inositol monophosphatase family protein [Alphaproteobacteria bacterium]|nr:inositol monophosphatase family protein [Alphaproteobacteria bacterium]